MRFVTVKMRNKLPLEYGPREAEILRDLTEASKGLKDMGSFPEKLEASKALASEIVATFAVQKGIESADSIDIFRADLDNYLVLAKKEGLKRADRDKIADRLSLLSEMALQYAKKEFNNPEKVKTASTNHFKETVFAKS